MTWHDVIDLLKLFLLFSLVKKVLNFGLIFNWKRFWARKYFPIKAYWQTLTFRNYQQSIVYLLVSWNLWTTYWLPSVSIACVCICSFLTCGASKTIEKNECFNVEVLDCMISELNVEETLNCSTLFPTGATTLTTKFFFVPYELSWLVCPLLFNWFLLVYFHSLNMTLIFKTKLIYLFIVFRMVNSLCLDHNRNLFLKNQKLLFQKVL